MGKIKNTTPRKKLRFSGIPVICYDCSTELNKDLYEKCSVCGAYLCKTCKGKHKH